MGLGIYNVAECDRCGIDDKMVWDSGTEGKPPTGWSVISVKKDGQSKTIVLCPECTDIAAKALEPRERKRKS